MENDKGKWLELVRKGIVFPYQEDLYPEDSYYYYRIAAGIGDKDFDFIIDPSSVDIDIHDGPIIFTNIKPGGLFPGAASLTPEQLVRIMDLAIDIKFEGMQYMPDAMDPLYNRYKREDGAE